MPRPKKPRDEVKKLVNMWLEKPLATTLQQHAKTERRTFTNLVEYILNKYLIDANIPLVKPAKSTTKSKQKLADFSTDSVAKVRGQSSNNDTDLMQQSDTFPTISIEDSSAVEKSDEDEKKSENEDDLSKRNWVETPFD